MAGDDWALTDTEGVEPASRDQYIANVAAYFAGTRKEKFLIYSNHFTYGITFRTALTQAGYTFEQTMRPGPLDQYAGVFVGGTAGVDREALAEYIRRGGRVHLVSGTGEFNNEDGFWNEMLKEFGMRLDGVAHIDRVPVTSFAKVPIFEGVKSLVVRGPSKIEKLPGEFPNTHIVATREGLNHWAIYFGDRRRP